MNEISKNRYDKVLALDELRERIAKLEVLSVCVYQDGSISPYEDGVNVTLDDSGYESLFSKFLSKDDFQHLRVVDIKSLARAIRIVENSALTIELMFDNSELEVIYDIYKEGELE